MYEGNQSIITKSSGVVRDFLRKSHKYGVGCLRTTPKEDVPLSSFHCIEPKNPRKFTRIRTPKVKQIDKQTL